LTPEGAAVLAKSSPAWSGRRLVLVVNHTPIGVVRLDRPVLDGRIVLFVELSETELTALVQSLNVTLPSRAKRSFVH
jgi:hypothetical protein